MTSTKENRPSRSQKQSQAHVGPSQTKEAARFECTICPKVFTRAATLRDHYRTHTGTRPFICDICSKSFTCLKDKKRHCVRHQEETNIVCRGRTVHGAEWGCGLEFTREDGLISHLRRQNNWACLPSNPKRILLPFSKEIGLDDLDKIRGTWTCQFGEDGEPGARKSTRSCCGQQFSTRNALRHHFRSSSGLDCLRWAIPEILIRSARRTRQQKREPATKEGIAHTMNPLEAKQTAEHTLSLTVKVLSNGPFCGVEGDVLKIIFEVLGFSEAWSPVELHFGDVKVSNVGLTMTKYTYALHKHYILTFTVPPNSGRLPAQVPIKLRLDLSGNLSYYTYATAILGYFTYQRANPMENQAYMDFAKYGKDIATGLQFPSCQLATISSPLSTSNTIIGQTTESSYETIISSWAEDILQRSLDDRVAQMM